MAAWAALEDGAGYVFGRLLGGEGVASEALVSLPEAVSSVIPRGGRAFEGRLTDLTRAVAAGRDGLSTASVLMIDRLSRTFRRFSRPFRRLTAPKTLTDALSGLAPILGEAPAPVLSLVQRYEADPRFLKSLLHLGLVHRRGLLSRLEAGSYLLRAASWHEELGPRHSGFDLIEKAMRAGLKGFMESDPRSVLYEIDVVRRLLADERVLRVYPIEASFAQRGGRMRSTPDYRVVRRLSDGGSEGFFVEAKLFLPLFLDLKGGTRRKFLNQVREAAVQLRSHRSRGPRPANRIYIAVVDEEGRLRYPRDSRRIRQWVYWHLHRGTSPLLQGVGMVHVDFYGRGLKRRRSFEVWSRRFR